MIYDITYRHCRYLSLYITSYVALGRRKVKSRHVVSHRVPLIKFVCTFLSDGKATSLTTIGTVSPNEHVTLRKCVPSDYRETFIPCVSN